MDGLPAQPLPTDVLKSILDHIEPYPDEPIPIDRRRFLSIESFDTPPDSPPGSVADIGRFRCACKEFARLGAPLLFRRVAARFSRTGLARLEQLAEWRHLAKHVRKFSYLVPYFFEDGADNVAGLHEELAQIGLNATALDRLQKKAVEQRLICRSREDVRVLNKAISTFSSLQFIQLLRVTDAEDTELLNFLHNNIDARRAVSLDWTLACSHASSTIGRALLLSDGLPWSRFSSPALSPASVQFLRVTNSLSSLAERLTCLTLHFDDGDNLDSKMRDLSGLFAEVFRRAKDMQAVHLGFPSSRPLTLPLEDIFHNVTWDKLVAFGVQGWELDAAEIIGIARRHRDRLKGLRLREVHLKENSMWREVLYFLREEMHHLNWVSLRRIGYSSYFHSALYQQELGAEIGDYPFNTELDSSDDSDDDDVDNDLPIAGPSHSVQENGDEFDGENSDAMSDSDRHSNDDYGPGTNDMDFPQLNSPSTPTSAPWCDCGGRGSLELIEDLGDDGVRVSNTKRKYWEKWVLRRCPEHGQR